MSSGSHELETEMEAGVAQLVEQLIRNEKVGSSNLLSGTIKINGRDSSRSFFFGQNYSAFLIWP